MTRCSRRAFVQFHERNPSGRLAFVPAAADGARVHIVVTAGQVVGRALCRLGKPGVPFEPAALESAALPCPACFDRARALCFRMQRKEEEAPGRL